jgi:hypothetical protein
MLDGLTVTETEVTCGAGRLCVPLPPHPTISSAHTAAPHTLPAHRFVPIASSLSAICLEIRENCTRHHDGLAVLPLAHPAASVPENPAPSYRKLTEIPPSESYNHKGPPSYRSPHPLHSKS